MPSVAARAPCCRATLRSPKFWPRWRRRRTTSPCSIRAIWKACWRAAAPLQTTNDGASALTPRELEVLRMMADGAANKIIAWKLGVSEHTAKFHVASILAKLGAASRTEAVTIGIRKGMVLL